MSKYSWKFYSARRGVSLKRIVEEKEIKSYEDFSAWCSKNRVTPPSEEVFNEEVGAMLAPPPKKSAAPRSAASSKQPKTVKKSTPAKKSTKSTRKSSTGPK